MDVEEGDALRLIPTAVRLLTERASHGDWNLRSSWLSHLGKSYQYIPGERRGARTCTQLSLKIPERGLAHCPTP